MMFKGCRCILQNHWWISCHSLLPINLNSLRICLVSKINPLLKFSSSVNNCFISLLSTLMFSWLKILQLGSAELFTQESKFLTYGNGKDKPATGIMFEKEQMHGLYFNQSPTKVLPLFKLQGFIYYYANC